MLSVMCVCVASEWARTPGKSVTFCTSDTNEESSSPTRAAKGPSCSCGLFCSLFLSLKTDWLWFSLFVRYRISQSEQNPSEGEFACFCAKTFYMFTCGCVLLTYISCLYRLLRERRCSSSQRHHIVCARDCQVRLFNFLTIRGQYNNNNPWGFCHEF